MYSTVNASLRAARHSRSSSLGRGSCSVPSAIQNDKRHLLPWGASETSADKPSKSKKGTVVKKAGTAELADAAQDRREKRRQLATARTGLTRESEARITELERIAFHDEERKEPNWGGFAKGEMKWYALWVNTTHEEEVGMDLANSISNLGTTEDANGKKVERIANPWVPTKMAMKWNGRSRRLTEQPVKYGGGNWVFIECIMDDAVYKLIEQMPVVNSFRKDSCIELRDGFGAVRTFPRPLSADFLAGVNTWLEERADDDLAEVKRDLYGVAVDEDTRTLNERIDGDPEFVEKYVADEVNEKGERVRVQRSRYKSEVEYSGTYENPSGWFDAGLDDDDDADAAGGGAAKRGRKATKPAADTASVAQGANTARGADGGAVSGLDRSTTGTFDELEDLPWADAGAGFGDAEAGGATGWGESAAATGADIVGAAAVPAAGGGGGDADGLPSGGLWDDWGDIGFGDEPAGDAVPAVGSFSGGAEDKSKAPVAQTKAPVASVEDDGLWDIWGGDDLGGVGGAAADAGGLWGDEAVEDTRVAAGRKGAGAPAGGGRASGGSSAWDSGFDTPTDLWGGDDSSSGGAMAWDSPGASGRGRGAGEPGRAPGPRREGPWPDVDVGPAGGL